jgi:hypothetical protein
VSIAFPGGTLVEQMNARLGVLILGLVLGSPGLAAVQPCGLWQWSNPSPDGSDLLGVAYGPHGYVAVDAAGTILASSDGSAWGCRGREAATSLNAAASDGTRYVVVGSGGLVLVSSDGASWAEAGRVGGDSLFAVAWGGGQFVAVGANGTILTSPDGFAWTRQVSGTTLPLLGVGWNGHGYVAVSDGNGSGYWGDPSSCAVLNSTDGVTWSAVWLPEATSLRAVASDGVRWVVVGSFCGPAPISGCTNNALVASSPDGMTWSVQKMADRLMYWGVLWSGTEFVAVGLNGMIATSADGASWSAQSTPTRGAVLGVAAGASALVAVGERGLVMTSTDARDWAVLSSDLTPRAGLERVVHGNGLWVISNISNGSWPGPLVLVSSDAKTWQAATSDWFASCVGSFGPVASNGFEFLVPCGPGKVLASTDGVTWSRRFDQQSLPLVGLTWSGIEYLGFGYDVETLVGSVYSSRDGSAWTLEFTMTGHRFSGAASDALGTVMAGGTLFYKPRGGAWIGVASPASSFRAVARGPGAFVAVGDGGIVARSADGLLWTEEDSGVTADLADITWTGAVFLAVGSGGTILRSWDGFTWIADPPIADVWLETVTSSGGCTVAAGLFTVILRNGCGSQPLIRRHLAPKTPGSGEVP